VNKENIFEELNKMRNLMVAKAGTVISEQANPSADVGTIMRELDKNNSDESAIVNIVKKYKDKASLKNFVDQYKTITGKDFGTAIFTAIQPFNDKTEWDDLTNHLKTLGVALTYQSRDNRLGGSYAVFGGLDTPAAPPAGGRTPEAINNINANFCSVRDGKINTGGSFKGKPWTLYKDTYKVTAEEEAAAQKICPNVRVGNVTSGGSGSRSGGGSGQNVNNRFAKSAESMGIQGGKMDLQTLQSILKTLEGGQSTPAVATASTQGAPDLAQLTAALNQLNA
jgi:hypothetical protein